MLSVHACIYILFIFMLGTHSIGHDKVAQRMTVYVSAGSQAVVSLCVLFG
jgi:hypothetical protein